MCDLWRGGVGMDGVFWEFEREVGREGGVDLG